MTKKKRGLGKGLDALLANTRQPVAVNHEVQMQDKTDASVPDKTDQTMLRHLPIEWITPGRYQPRRDIQPEALEELAESIKAQGLMQPIVVRPLSGQSDRFEIIAGERRWRACQMARFDKVPALVNDVADDAAIAMALIENVQRENLNPMEEAIALHRLQHEFELTQAEVAQAIGKNRTTVANLLRLMNLNDDVKTLLERGDIELGHAKALLGLQGDSQSNAAATVVAKSMTVRQTESLVRQIQSGGQDKTVEGKTNENSNADVSRLERLLGDRLGATVSIKHSAKGNGKLVISYGTLDELDGILAHIK